MTAISPALSALTRDLRMERLAEENGRLRERVAELERIAFGAGWSPPPEWRLTHCQTVLLGALVKRGRATREQLQSALYGLRPDVDRPGDRTLEVHISNLREKLAPHGIAFRTVRGVGYELDGETRRRIKEAS